MESNETFALQMAGIRKTFGTTEVLHGVDFNVCRGEIHALAGSNGAGKSTLMKIARGVVRPTSGTVVVASSRLTFDAPDEAERAGLAMVFQERSLAPTLTALDNMFLNREIVRGPFVDAAAQRREANVIMSRLGVHVDLQREVNRLGVAEQQVVEVAKALRLAKVAFLLDEPTGALSRREIDRLFAVLRQVAALGAGVVLITHHLGEIFEIADRVSVLRDGDLTLSSSVKDVSLQDVVYAMVGRQLAGSTKADVQAVSAGHARALMEVSELGVAGKLESVSFTLRPGEILGLAGLAGSGRTVLLKSLYGAIRRSAGRVSVDARLFSPRDPAEAISRRVYLIPENRWSEGLLLQHSVVANAVLSVLDRVTRFWFYDGASALAIASRLTRQLNVKTPSLDTPLSSLSGGNQQKVVLAKALATDARIMLLDEPTFGIDIAAAEEIRGLVRGFVGEARGAIWASSDLQELIQVADRILVLADGRIRRVIENRSTVTSEAELLAAMQRPGGDNAEPHAA